MFERVLNTPLRTAASDDSQQGGDIYYKGDTLNFWLTEFFVQWDKKVISKTIDNDATEVCAR